MRLIKMLGLAALAAVAAMAFIGATSASALKPTQLCTAHTSLTCSSAATSVHHVLATGTVGKLLTNFIVVLCLGVLVEATPLALGKPQSVHAKVMSFTGCGSGSAHDNCTVAVEELPLANLLKTGLDEGSLTATNGRLSVSCLNLGIEDCKFHLEDLLVSAGAQHLIASETPLSELLGKKFFCPGEGKLDGLLETLTNTYVLA